MGLALIKKERILGIKAFLQLSLALFAAEKESITGSTLVFVCSAVTSNIQLNRSLRTLQQHLQSKVFGEIPSKIACNLIIMVGQAKEHDYESVLIRYDIIKFD